MYNIGYHIIWCPKYRCRVLVNDVETRLKQLLIEQSTVFVDKWFPSSKLCSECGWKNELLALSDREWVCIQYGCVHDRDYNASVNILREGTSSLSACTNGANRI